MCFWFVAITWRNKILPQSTYVVWHYEALPYQEWGRLCRKVIHQNEWEITRWERIKCTPRDICPPERGQTRTWSNKKRCGVRWAECYRVWRKECMFWRNVDHQCMPKRGEAGVKVCGVFSPWHPGQRALSGVLFWNSFSKSYWALLWTTHCARPRAGAEADRWAPYLILFLVLCEQSPFLLSA